MFATFELCADVLIKVPPVRRHRRTVTGCLQCRKRKKKCDERAPVCTSCVKTGSDCSLAQVLSSLEGLCSPSSTSPRSSRQASPASSARGTVIEWDSNAQSVVTFFKDPEFLSLSKKAGSDMLLPADRQEIATQMTQLLLELRAARSSPLYTTIESPFYKIFRRPEEQRSLQSLTTQFHPMVTLSYTDPDRSILANGLPLIAEYRSIRSVFIACGLALVFRLSGKPADQQAALRYYSETMDNMSKDLMSLPLEANLSVVLLLLMFEDISSESNHRKLVHLKGAQTLISTAIKKDKLGSPHMVLLLEAYIFHVVTSALIGGLSWASTVPDDHVSNLLEILRTSTEKVLPGPLWAMGAILGVSQDLFDIAFRISQLRRRLPLQADDQLKAAQLQQQLMNWSAPVSSPEDGSSPQPPLEMILTAELYRLACQLILAKTFHPSLTSADKYARGIVQSSVTIMQQMPKCDFDTFFLHWPVMILGSGAVTTGEQTVFRGFYEREMQLGGFGSLIMVDSLLKHAWSYDHNLQREIGLDAILKIDYRDNDAFSI
ncbi:hypothetical protein PVAG01_03217 [Phlyctema vagabunda]|uniref:Zn(2)-C6 fungal-type domain-containing protein n=1 Tax=Phlyctema vagabunda TaxID=108571 RepID=A0ABR4PU74_9HELO